MEQADLIWHNGELVAWENAQVHVLTHGLHYGTGVFEGERCYDTAHGPAIFRHRDHLKRLLDSAELYYMPVPFTLEELRAATHELIAANGLSECYVRPIVYRGYGQMGLNPLDCDVAVSIAAWPWGAYLGDEAAMTGVRAKVSSWRRISPDSLIPHAKASGQYLNSVLAKVESVKAGYEEAILLDAQGFVSEGTGENVYVVRDGVIFTPPRPRASWTASAVSRSSPSPGISATRSWNATWPGPSCTWLTSCSSPGPRPSWCRCARSTTTPSASRVAGGPMPAGSSAA